MSKSKDGSSGEINDEGLVGSERQPANENAFTSDPDCGAIGCRIDRKNVV